MICTIPTNPPSSCRFQLFLETLLAFRFLYTHLKGASLPSLVQSLAVSTLNVAKNLVDIYLGYKVGR